MVTVNIEIEGDLPDVMRDLAYLLHGRPRSPVSPGPNEPFGRGGSLPAGPAADQQRGAPATPQHESAPPQPAVASTPGPWDVWTPDVVRLVRSELRPDARELIDALVARPDRQMPIEEITGQLLNINDQLLTGVLVHIGRTTRRVTRRHGLNLRKPVDNLRSRGICVIDEGFAAAMQALAANREAEPLTRRAAEWGLFVG